LVVTISHGFGKGFLAEFEWIGTADCSAFLCVETAIDFHRRLGGRALLARNIALAADAVALLRPPLNTEPGAEDGMAAYMGEVRIPLTVPAHLVVVERPR
jgi:isopenicillin-N epimerase